MSSSLKTCSVEQATGPSEIQLFAESNKKVVSIKMELYMGTAIVQALSHVPAKLASHICVP